MSNRILIVDDEPAITDTLDYALRSEGFETQCVHIGKDALDALRTAPANTFSLVVLDIGLPDLNGFDLCREIRQFSAIPVIFLTARNDEIDRIVGLELGADDYVTKPFSPREIVSRVRAVLRRTQSSSQQHKSHAPSLFEHNPESVKIAFKGTWLPLTRYEYRLLATLLERPGRVLSRAQLMEMVWQDHEESFERTVDAHIKTLRAKLRAVSPEDVIETHRGLGYSLKAGLA